MVEQNLKMVKYHPSHHRLWLRMNVATSKWFTKAVSVERSSKSHSLQLMISSMCRLLQSYSVRDSCWSRRKRVYSTDHIFLCYLNSHRLLWIWHGTTIWRRCRVLVDQFVHSRRLYSTPAYHRNALFWRLLSCPGPHSWQKLRWPVV